MITEYRFFNPKKETPKIGDYVIMNRYDLYGIIIDSGRMEHERKPKYYLIEILNHVSVERSETFKINFINSRYLIRTLNTPLKHENINGTWAGIYPNYMWQNPDYFTFYDENRKGEYDKAVEEIEMKETAKKYNL